jgi:hypothetical protein
MTTTLIWRPSSVLSFEVNAVARGVTYTITHHTPPGLVQGFYFAYVEDALLGQFDETTHGLAAAMRECQEHVEASLRAPSVQPDNERPKWWVEAVSDERQEA